MSDHAPMSAIEPFQELASSSVEAAPSLMDHEAPHPTPVVPTGEACPPPLVWQEVVTAFRKESLLWELDRGPRRLLGRVWGQGPPLYLINSFAGTAELYALMIWLLRDSFRCVVFDIGRGSKSGGRPIMSDYAADLVAAADHLGDPSISVFGPTFGAAVAMQAYLDHPGRIDRLVLQHGCARRRLSFLESQLAYWCGWSRGTLAALPQSRRIQEVNHRRWFPPFDGTRFEFLVDSTGRIPLTVLSQKAMAVRTFDIESRLNSVNCPVLLVRTEGQGRIEAEGHEVLEKKLPNARSEWLHSSGLHPYLTHPHRLAKLLKGFLFPNESTP